MVHAAAHGAGGPRRRRLLFSLPWRFLLKRWCMRQHMAPVAPYLRRRLLGWEGTNSSRVVVQSGKRKGLMLYTDAAGALDPKHLTANP